MPSLLRTRFLVIGSGVAGLHTAWRAAANGEVLVLTKRTLHDSATSYAQGGIAAALGAGDSPELHRQDTLAAGAALCDREAVEVLVEEGPARVRELQLAGAAFDLGTDGKLRNCTLHTDVVAHTDQGERFDAAVTSAEVSRYRDVTPEFCAPCPMRASCIGGCGAASATVAERRGLDPFVAQHTDPDFSASLRAARGGGPAFVPAGRLARRKGLTA